MATLYRFVMIIFLGFAGIAFAGTYKTVTVNTSATGLSEDKAIVKALGQAVQQANGTQINVQSHIRDTDQGIIVDWMGNRTVIPSQEINSGYTSAKAGGLIKSYKVTSSKYLAQSRVWQVSISAEVTQYTNIGADRSGLLQMVILPFHTSDSSYATVDGNVAAAEAARKFNELLTNVIVQSGKFRILDRSFWDESDKEELIIRERSYGTQESIKLGQKLGADYMIAGSIDDFDIQGIVEKMYDARTLVYETRFAIQLRIIEVATSDIIWSTQFTRTFEQSVLNDKLRELRASNPRQSEQQLAIELQNFIYATISNTMGQDIISHITGTQGGAQTAPAQLPAARPAQPLTPGSSEKPLEWQ